MDNNQNQPNMSDQPQTPVAGSGGLPPENPTPSVPTTPAQPSSVAPVSDPAPQNEAPEAPVSVPPSDGKKPLGLMIGALFVLLIVFFGLIYYFVLRNPSEPQQPVQQLPVQDLPQTPSPAAATPTPELNEDTVNSIDIGSPEAELSPIQADLDEL